MNLCPNTTRVLHVHVQDAWCMGCVHVEQRCWLNAIVGPWTESGILGLIFGYWSIKKKKRTMYFVKTGLTKLKYLWFARKIATNTATKNCQSLDDSRLPLQPDLDILLPIEIISTCTCRSPSNLIVLLFATSNFPKNSTSRYPARLTQSLTSFHQQ